MDCYENRKISNKKGGEQSFEKYYLFRNKQLESYEEDYYSFGYFSLGKSCIFASRALVDYQEGITSATVKPKKHYIRNSDGCFINYNN